MTPNNRINPDWQFRCAPLPAGYAERCRRAARVGNGGAKLPPFSSLLAP